MSDRQRPPFLVPFGGVELPLNRLAPHFLFVGTTESGKTLSIRMLMAAAIVGAGGQLGTRAMIYDAKREAYPMLLGMGIDPRDIKILCATDVRSVAWDMAADIQHKEHANTVARNLIPSPEKYHSSSGKFFDLTAAGVLAAVMTNLHRTSPGDWRMSDVVRTIRSEEKTGALLRQFQDTEQLYRDFLNGDPRTVDNIKATLTAEFVLKFETIATLWDRCRERISLRRWCIDSKPTVLLLAPDPTIKTVDAANLAIFEFLAQEMLALPESRGPEAAAQPRAWVFLDEFPFAGRIPLIKELCAMVRSKGIRLVLSTQSLDGMTDVYGTNMAHDIINNMGNLAVMRQGPGRGTAELAKVFGEYEAWENDFNESTTYNKSTWGVFNDSRSKTKSTSSRLVKRETVLPGTLENLPPVSKQNGIHGYFASPHMGPWRGPIPWSFVERRIHPIADVSGHDPRPPADYEPPDNRVIAPETPVSQEAKPSGTGAQPPAELKRNGSRDQSSLFDPPQAPRPPADADEDFIIVD